MAKKRWIDRQFKNRNVQDSECLPNMYRFPNGHTFGEEPLIPYLWCCFLPDDGEVTSAIAQTKEEAYRKWEALTLYYEGIQEEMLKPYNKGLSTCQHS